VMIKPLLCGRGVNTSFVVALLRLIRVNANEVRNRYTFKLLAVPFLLRLVVFQVKAVSNKSKLLFKLVIVPVVDTTVEPEVGIQTLADLDKCNTNSSKAFIVHSGD